MPPLLIFRIPGATKPCFCCNTQTDLFSIMDRAWLCLECLHIVSSVEVIAAKKAEERHNNN